MNDFFSKVENEAENLAVQLIRAKLDGCDSTVLSEIKHEAIAKVRGDYAKFGCFYSSEAYEEALIELTEEFLANFHRDLCVGLSLS